MSHPPGESPPPSKRIHPIADGKQFFQIIRESGLRAAAAWTLSKEAPFTFQFIKYGIAGVIATLVQLALFTLLTHTVFPAHDYLEGHSLTDEIKEKNAILSNLVAFPVTNLIAYLANIFFVFTQGRHSIAKEFTLFTIIGLISFAAGLGAPLLISKGLNPWIAQFGFVITSALVNFVLRKFVIFLK